MKRTPSKPLPPPREGFSVYPDPETVARLDKLAARQERKRAPMAVIAMKRGIEALERESK